MRQIEHQMDQANAARRQKINSQNGITEKEDLYQENYSDQSENSEDESSDSQKYQTPIQPPNNRRSDSEKAKQLMSTHPETIQKAQAREGDRKRDEKAKQKS